MPKPDAIRGEIVRLAHVDLDLHAFARDAASVLRRAVPFDGVAVVAFDPATALPVDKWIDNSLTGSAGSRLAEIELFEPDVNKISQLAASTRRAASLSQATGGKLDRSRRHRELAHPYGFGDELRTACVGDSGIWGGIVMHRERGAPHFSAATWTCSPRCPAVRGSLAAREPQTRPLGDAGDRDPGLLLLDDEDGVETADAAAAAWLDELPDDGNALPLVVTAVAQRARAIAAGHIGLRRRCAPGPRPGAGSSSAVCPSATAQPIPRSHSSRRAHPSRRPDRALLRAPVRERHVTELVAQGLTTTAIAARLHLSSYTVQDHLKAIFENSTCRAEERSSPGCSSITTSSTDT